MMTMWRQALWFVSVLLTTVLPVSSVDAQMDQRVLAQQLLRGDVGERSRALEMARALGPENTGAELRAALMTLLQRQNSIVVEARRRNEPLANREDPEFIATVSRVVAELRDPQAIPALSEAIYGGFTVIRALADFGERAVPAVLRVVTSPESHYDAVNHGLITLRFIVEGAGTRPLSASTLDQIRRAAEQRLTGKQYFTTLWRAVDLAAVLNDADLRRVVGSLAADWSEVVARGVEDPDLIAQTQKRAADRLAGIPPLPRP
jgi:hypothetical protein